MGAATSLVALPCPHHPLPTHLQYDGMVRAVEARHESEPRAGEPAFFLNFVRVAYERFLAEDDDKIDEIKASVADAFGEQHAVIQKDVTSRRAENARLRAEVDALRNQSVRATRTRCQSWSKRGSRLRTVAMHSPPPHHTTP